MEKVPFSEMKDRFLKQGVLKYDMGKWTSYLNHNNHKFHCPWKASILVVGERRLFN